MECIRFENQKKYIKDFIYIYHRLYKTSENMQNDKETEKILLGTHTLSKYFTVYKFCVYEKKQVIGRFVITEYPDDDNAYLGFFECENDRKIAEFIFKKAEEFSREKGFKRIIGPVDASFWIKYRLKINLFDKRAYTGEPYNKDYYREMFEKNGFEMIKHYTSSIYEVVEKGFINEKYKKRLEEFTAKGYEIKSPSIENWNETVENIYRMITRLFSDFPIYKDLSYEDFAENFSSYKLIVNFDMVRMAYYNGKAVGFFISIPNYHNAVYHTDNPINLLKILLTRKNPKEYVMLYMGVEPEHKGLGKAIVQSITDTLIEKALPSIGALQMDGKVTQNYVDEKIVKRYEYALYGKEL